MDEELHLFSFTPPPFQEKKPMRFLFSYNLLRMVLKSCFVMGKAIIKSGTQTRVSDRSKIPRCHFPALIHVDFGFFNK